MMPPAPFATKKQPSMLETAGAQLSTIFGNGEEEDAAAAPAAAPRRKGPTTIEMRGTPRRSLLVGGGSGARRAAPAPGPAAARRRGCCGFWRRYTNAAGLTTPNADDDVALLNGGDVDVLTEDGLATFLDRFDLPEARAPRDLDGAGRQRLLRLFDHFDGNGSRQISARELRIGLSRLHNAPTQAEAERMIAQLDLGRGRKANGAVDFEEFAMGLLARRCDLYRALYAQHRLSGVAVEPGDLEDDGADDARTTAKAAATLDSRRRLSAVISAYTGRPDNPLV